METVAAPLRSNQLRFALELVELACNPTLRRSSANRGSERSGPHGGEEAGPDARPRPRPESGFDLCPVLSAYRHAIEPHLKVIVIGDGGNFLDTRPDEFSVHKTRSLSWLAQFVVQIVTNLKWEGDFKTEGIENLADFKAVIEKVNGIDAPFQAFRCPADPKGPEILKSNVVEFLGRMDALLELLERTADGLAAEWDLRPEGFGPDDAIKPIVH